jgi:antitoxin StbD
LTMARTDVAREQEQEAEKDKVSKALADAEVAFAKIGSSVAALMRTATEVSAQTRVRLADILRRFRREGAEAPPVFFGSHRKPEAVLLSYEKYMQLLDHLDDLAIALEVRRHSELGHREPIEIEDLIRQEGYDPADFRAE